MTWLSEIELINKNIRCDGLLLIPEDETDRERMARVVRELAKMGHLLLHTMNEFGQQKYLDILSSDAKEVIDDCTAPRST